MIQQSCFWVYPKTSKAGSHRDICTSVFTALFTAAKRSKPNVHHQMNVAFMHHSVTILPPFCIPNQPVRTEGMRHEDISLCVYDT